MSSNVLADRDVNAAAQKVVDVDAKPDVKSMEYHRQVLQSKLEESKYVLSSQRILAHMAMIATKTERGNQLILYSQGRSYLHLPLRQHHEPLHSQAIRLSQQASRKVSRYSQYLPLVPITPSFKNTNTNNQHRAKPRSLFAKTSAKNLSAPNNNNIFGSSDVASASKLDDEDHSMGGQ